MSPVTQVCRPDSIGPLGSPEPQDLRAYACYVYEKKKLFHTEDAVNLLKSPKQENLFSARNAESFFLQEVKMVLPHMRILMAKAKPSFFLRVRNSTFFFISEIT